MDVYTVTALSGREHVETAIDERFSANNIRLSVDSWFIAGSGTAQEITGQLGFPIVPGQQSPAALIVTKVAGYYGFASNNIWEWVRTKQAVNG